MYIDTKDNDSTGRVCLNAEQADKLSVIGTIQVNLENNDSVTYTDGGDITPGVSGILQPINGGTGNITGRVQIGQREEEAIGENATSEGYNTVASGSYSHAEGYSTTASGNGSHAEGYWTQASSISSHAGGYGTRASGNYSTIFGRRDDNQSVLLSGSANTLTYTVNIPESIFDSSTALSGQVSSSGSFTSSKLPTATSSSPTSVTTYSTEVQTLKGGYSYKYQTSQSTSGGSLYFTTSIYLFSSRSDNTFSGLIKTYQSNTQTEDIITIPAGSTYYIVYLKSKTSFRKTTLNSNGNIRYYYKAIQSYHALGTPFIDRIKNIEDISIYKNGYFLTGQKITSISTTNNTITLNKTLSTSEINYKQFSIFTNRGAKGEGSFVIGLNNSANGSYQTVIGKNNLEDTTSAFIIGNGTIEEQSNAYIIDWDGNSTQTGTSTSAGFIGPLTGNADTATKATQDASGNIITDTYETKADALTKIENVQSQLNNKVDSYTFQNKLEASDTIKYGKICTINIEDNSYGNIHLDFDLIGRGNRYEKVIVRAEKGSAPTLTTTTINFSGTSDNIYLIHGYKYITTTGSEYIEIWCTINHWEGLRIRQNHLSSYGGDSHTVTWDCTEYDSLPVASDTIIKIEGIRGIGNAITANKFSGGWKGNYDHPIFLNNGDPQAVTSIKPSLIGSGKIGDNGLYLSSHPETSSTIIPFIYNDIAHLIKKGGSCVLKINDNIINYDFTNNGLFDGTPNYGYVGTLSSVDDIITFELTLHKDFEYSNKFYIDFGNEWWAPSNIKMETLYSKQEGDVWQTKINLTNQYVKSAFTPVMFSHQPLGQATDHPRFDKIKITLSGFQHTNPRVAEIGLINFSSRGVAETYLSIGGGTVYGNITAENFIGNASNDSNGNKIVDTYTTKETKVIAGTGLTGGGDLSQDRTLSLATSGVTAGTYGPSANVTGTSQATITVPQFTIDTHGRVTAAASRTYTTMTVDSAMNSTSTNPVQNKVIKAYIDGKVPNMSAYLPKSAGEAHKLTGALGLTENVMYGTELPATGFDGQLFFLEDDTPSLPLGGEAGHVLIKNSATDGDASWKELVALPKGGTAGQVLVKSSVTDGDAIWSTDISGNAATATKATQDGNGLQIDTGYLKLSGGTMTGTLTTQSCLTILSQDSVHEGGEIILSPATSSFKTGHIDMYDNKIRYHDGTTEYFSVDLTTGNATAKALYGAVWNDYAEFRNQKEIIEPGYCVASVDNGQVYKTTEKFQACDGIVSDTFGFAIGETDECKTPLAVAGRVLAYYSGNRENYHAGDTVCAGPEGKVCKMTREEIREWPDRIIGIVSEIPEYESWGTGNVPVNGRIWIKIK